MTFNKTKIYQTYEADIRTLVIKNPHTKVKVPDELVKYYRFMTKDAEKIRRQLQRHYKGLSVRVVGVGTGHLCINDISKLEDLGKIDKFKPDQKEYL